MIVCGVIPMRAGSKGIINKNTTDICGKRLFEHTLGEAKKSNLFSTTISTDYDLFGDIAKNKLPRPPFLCKDDTPMIYVVKHFLATKPFANAVMVLQPTSPLRTWEDINNSLRLFKKSGANSLYSGYYIGIKHKDKVYDKHTSEKHFQRNGAIFIAKRELIEQGKLWDPNSVIEYEMPFSRSIDIDTYEDLFICESILKNRDSILNKGFI